MNKEILRLAIPNILSNISVPLISTVDTILMGHLSAAHLGAVGIGSMIFNFIYWNFGFLRMGTTGLTAQAYGAKNKLEIGNVMWRACALGLFLAVLILILQYPLGELSYFLMNVSEEHYSLVKTYFLIRVLAAPATLALYSIFGWLFGMQNAIYPLVLTIFLNLINVFVSALLVLGFGLEVSGVAWGTVIAQYSGLLLALLMLRHRYKAYLMGLSRNAVLRLDEMKRFLRVNRDIFIRTLCLTFAFGFFYSLSSKAGELNLAASVILLQLLNWMSHGVDGFAYAAESVVGKYVGAADKGNTRKAIRYSFFWGGGLAVLYGCMYWFFGEWIVSLFSNESEVISFTLKFLFWMALLPLAGFASYIWDGIYIGFTASKAMRDTMIMALIIYLGTYYLVAPTYPAHSLWIALITFLFARGLIQTVYFILKGERIN